MASLTTARARVNTTKCSPRDRKPPPPLPPSPGVALEACRRDVDLAGADSPYDLFGADSPYDLFG